MEQDAERRLKARNLDAEYRRIQKMEPATYNFLHEVPAWMKYDPMFEAIWNELKTWDVNVPTEYSGYCGASGSHAAAILSAIIDRGIYQPNQVGSLVPELPEVRI